MYFTKLSLKNNEFLIIKINKRTTQRYLSIAAIQVIPTELEMHLNCIYTICYSSTISMSRLIHMTFFFSVILYRWFTEVYVYYQQKINNFMLI